MGHSGCSHIAYGDNEEALFRNAEYHAVKAHGYTEQSWEDELSKNLDILKKNIKRT
jgi:predicted small metal-binding protein